MNPIVNMTQERNPKRNSDDFRNLFNQIIKLTTQNANRIQFLKSISLMLKQFSKCDIIEIRIKQLHDNNKCEMIRTTRRKQFFRNISCYSNKNNNKNTKSSLITDLLQSVVIGKVNLSEPFLTDNGSFWVNDFLNPTIRERLEYHFPKILKSQLFADNPSILIVPLIIGKDRIGVIEFRSEHSYFFTQVEVSLWEEFASTLGIILINQRDQVDLKERIKELTCLYGISKLVETPDISMYEIFQGVVNLLPQAWQYPDNTCAKIIYDNMEYISQKYRNVIHTQSADIIIRNEKLGSVQVSYIQDKPEMDEGPFLKEERDLINLISKQISLIVERRHQIEEKEKLEKQLLHADRLATIGQLSAGIAHELNEPLSTILGFAQLIQKETEVEQTNHDLDKIINASLHAREVIKKLLLFARQTPPKMTLVNLNDIVNDGLYFLESRCAKKNITINRELAENLSLIKADPSQLNQILINLVVNSIQALNDGGLLKIKTYEQHNSVLLSIYDNGYGMDEITQKKIFLPFFTTKDVGEGTGIGLSVVHGIVKSHKGTIDVASKPGQGTTFVVTFPVNETSKKQKDKL